MKGLTFALLLLAPLAAAIRPAKADYGYGSFAPSIHPYYDRWRPWWGGLCGWKPYHGCSAYPAYRCKPTSGYRFCPGYYPSSSWYYGYPDYSGGYAQYPRTFVYDWSPEDGDQAPHDTPQPEQSQIFEAP